MNNIITYFKKYLHLIVFFILAITCFVFIYNSMYYQRFVISTVAQRITGPINNYWSKVMQHFSLVKENEWLIQQNILLLREKENIFMIADDSTYTVEQHDFQTNKRRLYDYRYAHVIFNTTHKKHNYMIIDKGEKDGIYSDMAVLSAQGVVGIVNDVSNHFSSVITLLHPSSRVSAKIMPINQIGTVVWLENDPTIGELIDIPQHLSVNIGDSVFTSGYSNLFPGDILIGTVVEKFDNSKNTFLTIKIKFATYFNNINTVYVVSNIYKPELDSLKSKFKNE